ncbi:transcriptional regulator [Vibrio variabilis]|uniref:Transcriptional regulator n=2 Tax=Vibrio TaxID=662 RepID=A0ABQ0JQG1_9VIBR|nr:transcriptional regulator [Vibrio variabilis]
MAAAASQRYLDQFGEPTHPNHLAQHSCIIANNDHWQFEKEGKPMSAIRVSGRWRSNNSNAILQACEEGLGIAYLPRSSFGNKLALGRLKPVLEPFWGKGSSSWIVYQNRRFLPVRARMAIDYLVKHFSDWQE